MGRNSFRGPMGQAMQTYMQRRQGGGAPRVGGNGFGAMRPMPMPGAGGANPMKPFTQSPAGGGGLMGAPAAAAPKFSSAASPLAQSPKMGNPMQGTPAGPATTALPTRGYSDGGKVFDRKPNGKRC